MTKFLEETEKVHKEDDEILTKLKKLLDEQNHNKTLTEEEVAKVRKMIDVYESIEAFGRLSKFVRTVIIFLGTLLVGWFLIVDNASGGFQKLILWLFG